ncbi:MAG: succinate dehydrogenase assembly factor 2 [Thiomicrorhabdus sp.]|nr:succinate dehydrogenase assembly factor 2 [Thiomicrorhabdus sp.]
MSAEHLILADNKFNNWRRKSLFLAKRGNLESELLLAKFLEDLNEISTEKAQLFREFLSENDQNLFRWLMTFDPKTPHEAVRPPDKYLALIQEIRENYLK